MKNCLHILFLALLPVGYSSAQDTSFTVPYYVGDAIIQVEKKCFGGCEPGILFLNLHDNENTSVTAAEYLLCEKGGNLVTIQNCEERLVAFTLNGYSFLFDPNRIYSQEGITATLTLLSPCFDEAAANEVAAFAYQLLTNYVDKSTLVIALHNNTDKELSVLSYQKDQAVKLHAGKVFVNPAMDADDFILTTDSAFFSRIRDKNLNAVWENVDSTKDDGSLSIYCGRHSIPYLNVEAQHGHTDQQVAMLDALQEIVAAYNHNRRVKEAEKKTAETSAAAP